jgi:hypothetical protein
VSPELPQHEIRSSGLREPSESIDTPVFADPIAAPHVVRMRVVGVAGLPGLPGREEAALQNGNLIETFFRD